ncbi:DNA polymerase III subunit alpha [Spiroplasma endosymbiont of Virgichneumon dumeticola]|uniref:DNA polymerase III subunit alpha n=1 Tax=Spiroplasma endosymbiont of Virgichneumon dumeticola TaxID=3139323 RepID=UPI0035C91F8D
MKYAVNLNVRSNCSFLSSTIKISEYIAFAKKNNIKTLSLVDRNMLYGAYDFYSTCVENDIQPLIGLNCTWENINIKVNLTLMATNYSGYQKLMTISTIISTNNGTINNEIVQRYLTAGREIIVIIHADKQNVRYIKNIYDILNASGHQLIYFGLVPSDMVNIELLKGITKNIIPIDLVLYLEENQHSTYQILKAIKEQKQLKPKDLVKSKEFIFKTQDQLHQEYPIEIIENIEKLVLMCDIKFPKTNLITKELNLPNFPCPSGLTSPVYLQELCKQGLEKRFQSQEISQVYVKRILYELQVINEMGFADYFLIVNDYVKFAKNQNIMVGPGRGSVAGSLVAYVLGISDVDPIVYNLIFERFLNPQRISLPDIDIDFEDTRRDEIIEYIRQKYGQEHVAYIVTFQTIASKMAIRDLGRVFQISMDDINEMSKLVLIQYNFDIEAAIKNSAKLQWYVSKYPLLFTLTKRILGFPRQTSTHAAGIIIAKTPLVDTVPLQLGFNGIYQTQFPMQTVANLGLVKMDILGLRNLTILQDILKQVSEHYSINLNLSKIPLNDERTFTIIKNGDTSGIFQLESPGMRQILIAMQTNSFEDIIAASSLFRPGPQDYIQDYINCKLGKSKPNYVHPDLIPFLQSTYGIVIYQEQILLILQKIAGYSLAKADLIRRAIGKKDDASMKAQASEFMKSATARGYQHKVIKQIWDDIAKFAGYGFNRSHAVAYSLISYYLVYLKANYPLPFMVCLLSSVIGNDQKMLQYLNECQKYNIKILPPSVQYSGVDFLIDVNNQAIRYSLQAIKQMSQGACSLIIKDRNSYGLYRDFFNFCARVIFIGLNRKNIEFLIAAGAFDDLEQNRTMLLINLNAALEYANMAQIKDETTQKTILNFNLISKPIMLQREDDWNNNSINEYRALGVYLKYNPKTLWQQQLDVNNKAVDLVDLNKYVNQYVRVYGIIINIKTILTKNQKLMSFLELQNENTIVAVTVFHKLYQIYQEYFQINKVILMEAKVEIYQGKLHLVLVRVISKI